MAGNYESGMNMLGNIDGGAMASPGEWLGTVTDGLEEHSVLWVKGVPPEAAAETYGSLVESLCQSKGASTNGWSDIKATSGAENYNRPRRFHTDGAASVLPIDVVVMYCEKPAEDGGSNIFGRD